MKTQDAISLAGNAKALADLLGISQSAVSQWDEEVPKPREWQLRVLRPHWFKSDTGQRRRSTDKETG